MTKKKIALVLRIAALIAVLFGVVTIYSGGRVLFGSSEAKAAAGNIVAFVLWFNFSAGFVYVVSGIGLFLKKKWAVWLAAVIAFATVLVFAAFGVHILMEGAFEMRTVGAMTFRGLVWIGIAIIGFNSEMNGAGKTSRRP